MLDSQTSEKQITDRRNSAIKISLDSFMAKDSTRLLVSMIPQGETQGIIEALLKEALIAGFSTGEGSMAMEFMLRITRENDRGGHAK
jgi:hypothetical protein